MKRSILFLALGSLLPLGLAAQEPPATAAEWNGERALELIRRAQQRRTEANADTGLVSYQADARLRVYFYLDRTDTGERNLVKTDQLALEVFWRSPDLVKQRIVGWRDQKSLPTNIHYHLDHLTVVQENFGDEIRLGDGDEVRGVTHPAAPGAESTYDYRLADSLTLRLPGADEPVRVYELQVRPKELDRPGFLGSVFVERRNGDLVRMDFTFTAASYIDRFLDYINISLDNGLWRGRFWLPNQQRVEIRRQIPELDIPAGSVIRANMQVGNYRFNEPLPLSTFAGPAVTALPRAQREAFPFEEEIHAEVRELGLGPDTELREIRQMARQLVRRQALSRVEGVRVRIPRASDVFRYNRAEGAVVALGTGLTPLPDLRIGVQGGWAFGAGHPLASLSVAHPLGGGRIAGRLYVNQPRDAGSAPAASGVLNTLSSLVAGEDYLDPYYASGASLSVERRMGAGWSLAAGGRLERQRSAALESRFSLFGDMRPVRPIDAADLLVAGDLALRRESRAEAERWWTAEVMVDGGMVSPDSAGFCPPGGAGCAPAGSYRYARPRGELRWGRRWTGADLLLLADAGTALGELPRQALYLLGGRGTLPGYGFRAFAGDRYLILGATSSTDLRWPWVRARLLGRVGWSGVGDAGREALARWGAPTTGGAKPALGVGLGLIHDIVRVDLLRGLADGGRWELIVEANPSFWDFL